MNKEIMVSVIMPVYNAVKYIEEAIDSIIKQTYANWELIVINDCSSDSSMKIVNKFVDLRIRVYHNDRNRGIAYSRNRAISLSRGKYIAIMDHDDISMPTRFENQVQYLEENDQIDILGGSYECIDENGEVIARQTGVLKNPKYIKARLLFQNVFCNGEVMLRKLIIDQHGIKYLDDQYGLEDFRFWVECSKVASITSIEDLVFQHRLFKQNETSRVMREKQKERKECYADIQCYSFFKSGFNLEDEELRTLTYVFNEKQVVCDNIDELKKVYDIFNKILYQAKQLKMDNYEEIDIICKQKIGAMIRKCENFFKIG